MDKITQLLEKLKTEIDRFNDDHTGFEETIKEIGEILDEAAIYLDDISHELKGDGFCEECGEWYTPIDGDEYFLCYECMQEIAEDVWQKQYQSESIPYDEL